MPYCTKCGAKLDDGDLFCRSCGAPASRQASSASDTGQARSSHSTEQSPNASSYQQTYQQTPSQDNTSSEYHHTFRQASHPAQDRRGYGSQQGPSSPEVGQKSGSKNNLIVIGAVALGLVIIALIIFLWLVPALKGAEKTNYARYTNENVCFALDYPEGYQVNEYIENGVFISDGDDFRIAAEYAYYTAGGSFIYSAEDFAQQINDNSQVLADWVDNDDLKITKHDHTRVAGRDCYIFEYRLPGAGYDGCLYIFDSEGAYGCYCYQYLVSQDAKKAELYEAQLEHITDSFEITGRHTPEELFYFHDDETEMTFMLPESFAGRAENSGGDSVVIYPVDGVFSDANIWIMESSYGIDKDPETLLEDIAGYYFSKYDRTQYTSQVTYFDMGRYSYNEVDVGYYDDGQSCKTNIVVFPHNDSYWRITVSYIDEYSDIMMNTISQVLSSLKFDNETWEAGVPSGSGSGSLGDTPQTTDEPQPSGVNINDSVSSIIKEIEGRSGYIYDIYMAPLASLTDVNGDGNYEFLAVYKTKEGNDFNVMLEIWSIRREGSFKLGDGLLYQEVGGNGGELKIVVDKDGTYYILLDVGEPAGDQFNNYYLFYPWTSGENSVGDMEIYMEAHGSYEEPGSGGYIIDDIPVDKSSFDKRLSDFTELVSLDIQGGPEAGLGAMTFDYARTCNFN